MIIPAVMEIGIISVVGSFDWDNIFEGAWKTPMSVYDQSRMNGRHEPNNYVFPKKSLIRKK